MKKKILLSMIIFCMMIIPSKAVGFEDITYFEDKYELVNVAQDSINSVAVYDTYEDAYKEFDLQKDSYDNLAITFKGLFLRVEYGIVTFIKSDACDLNVEFNNVHTGTNNYINGCYGVDGVYIDTNQDQKVSFKISGIEGSVDINKVTIIPLNFIHDYSLSTYIVKNGTLYHQVKNDIDTNYYMNLIELGSAPDYLSEDVAYYSYDGHYFYDNMYTLIDDMHYGSNNSINKDTPYYNYYQFVSHRTLTNIKVDELKDYYRNTLGIDDVLYSYQDNDYNSVDDTFTRSQFYNNEECFYQYQYQYGANAAMMIALATNESSLGRSSLAFTRNNLFGHAAYDSDVERNASRYLSVNSSVYSHAKYYISGAYCYPLKYQYHGGFFGNKSSGMNVSYASDPYWGEKAAQYYYRLDKALGFKDLNQYTLGIISDYDVVSVYQFPDPSSNVLYSSTGCKDYSFVLLEEFNNEFGSWYKVQSDATLDDNSEVALNYYYDYQNHVGYINKDSVDIIIPGSREQLPFYTVTFDANGGSFRDGSSTLSYRLSDTSAVVETPVKENAIFTGWDKSLDNITQDTIFVATYKDVASIEIKDMPKSLYELNDRIDINGGSILVKYQDGSEDTIAITTDMVSNYNLGEAGIQEVIVTYGTNTCSYQIEVSEELDNQYQSVKQKINDLLNSGKDPLSLTQEDKDNILLLKDEIHNIRLPRLPFNKLRMLDSYIYQAYDSTIEYGVSNKYNLQVSGLATSIVDDKHDSFLKDYYKLSLKEHVKHDKELEKVALGNEYSIHQVFDLVITKRFDEAKFNGAMVVSIDKPEGYKDCDVFTVFEYVDNQVRKCYTTQTDDQIQFITNGDYEYLVASKTSANIYHGDNVTEVINQDNSTTDIFAIIGVVVFVIFSICCGVVVYIRFRYILRKKKNDTKEDSVEENQISEEDI